MKNNYSFLITLLFILININSFSQNKPNICATDEYNRALDKNDPQRIEEVNLKRILFNNWKMTKSYATEKTVVIPVVFHIVHNGEQIGTQQNPSESKILEQLQILNDIYANNNNKGIDTKIKFCLAERDIDERSKKGILRYRGFQETFVIYNKSGDLTNDDRILKSFHRDSSFPRDKYLNIWVSNIFNETITGSLIELNGYSSFPWEIDPILDGVAINYTNLGLQPSSTKFGLGKSLIHEVGHWLGLYHTFEESFEDCFEDDCSNEGDRVCDTQPRQDGAWFGFTFPDTEKWTEDNCDSQESCVNGGVSTDAVQNYMDYNFHPCWKFFTQGQKERMKDMLSWYRYNIYNETDPPVGCTPGISVDSDGSTGSNSQNDDDGFGHHSFASYLFTSKDAVFNENWFFSLYSREIHIRKRVECESEYHQILSVGSLGYEAIRSGSSVTVIDKNTIAVVASKSPIQYAWGTVDERYLLIYKNFNDNWRIHKEILILPYHSSGSETLLSYNNNKLGVFYRGKASTSSLWEVNVSIYETSSGNFNLINNGKLENDSSMIDFQIDEDGNAYIYRRPYSGHEYIESYKRQNNTLTKIYTYVFPGSSERQLLKNWIISNNKLYVLMGYHFFIFKKNINTGIYEKTEDLYVNNLVGSDIYDFDVYNDIIIVTNKQQDNHTISFLKKENNEWATIENFSHLYNNPQPHLRKPCKAKYYNYVEIKVRADELLAGGKVLYKLNQLIGNEITSKICSLNNDTEIFGQNISIGGDCNVNIINVNKTISAGNRIIIKPGTKISNSNFVAKIQPKSSECTFIDIADTDPNSCSVYYRSGFSKEGKKTVLSLRKENLKIYPNPNNGTFYINNVKDIENIQLYNMMGQLIFDKKIIGNNEIVIPNIKNGLYNVIFYKKNKTKESVKIIINK